MAKDTHYNNYYLEPANIRFQEYKNYLVFVLWSSESEDVSDPTSPGFWDTSVLAVVLSILLRGLLFLCLAFECWLQPLPLTLHFLSGKSHPVQLLQFPHVCVILTCVLLSYIYPLNSRTTLTRQLCNMNMFTAKLISDLLLLCCLHSLWMELLHPTVQAGTWYRVCLLTSSFTSWRTRDI